MISWIFILLHVENILPTDLDQQLPHPGSDEHFSTHFLVLRDGGVVVHSRANVWGAAPPPPTAVTEVTEGEREDCA